MTLYPHNMTFPVTSKTMEPQYTPSFPQLLGQYSAEEAEKLYAARKAFIGAQLETLQALQPPEEDRLLLSPHTNPQGAASELPALPSPVKMAAAAQETHRNVLLWINHHSGATPTQRTVLARRPRTKKEVVFL